METDEETRIDRGPVQPRATLTPPPKSQGSLRDLIRSKKYDMIRSPLASKIDDLLDLQSKMRLSLSVFIGKLNVVITRFDKMEHPELSLLLEGLEEQGKIIDSLLVEWNEQILNLQAYLHQHS